MMRIILLLLVTLTGPFCTFTQASTLVAPTAIARTPEPSIGSNPVSDSPAFTGKTEEPAPQDAVSTSQPALEATQTAASTEEVPVASTAAPVIQSESTLETTAPTDSAQSTEAGPTETAGPEIPSVTTEARAEETKEAEVTVSTDANVEDEGMGAGQLAGIVIGALIAVIIVIAVIILVVRRMGQYSP